MEGEILYGVQKEIENLFSGSGCTVILKTDFSSAKWPTYKMPLILIDIEPGNDTQQMIGGLTMMDWQFSLSAYNYMPNIGGKDPTNYSATRINVADKLRVHFSAFAVMVAKEMLLVFTQYGIKWTLSGLHKADPLEHPNGLCKGHKIIFDTISWDLLTVGSEEKIALQTIEQDNDEGQPWFGE